MKKANAITLIAMAILALLVLLFITGCARVTVVKPDGTKIHYTRYGNQEIESFIMEADGSVLLEKQSSDNQALYEAMSKLVDKIP